jgi:hypothetical protein
MELDQIKMKVAKIHTGSPLEEHVSRNCAVHFQLIMTSLVSYLAAAEYIFDCCQIIPEINW